MVHVGEDSQKSWRSVRPAPKWRCRPAAAVDGEGQARPGYNPEGKDWETEVSCYILTGRMTGFYVRLIIY